MSRTGRRLSGGTERHQTTGTSREDTRAIGDLVRDFFANVSRSRQNHGDILERVKSTSEKFNG
jgi:hypothetical protein